jgi:hypothetical protein
VVPVDPVKILVPVVVVDELLALLGVNEPLAPVKPVIAGDPPSPVVLDKTVEPVSVVLILDRIVVCVALVVPKILRRKTSTFQRLLYY